MGYNWYEYDITYHFHHGVSIVGCFDYIRLKN